MDKARLEGRKKDFKPTADDHRRRREDVTVQIRKQQREAQVQKKRDQTYKLLSPSPASGDNSSASVDLQAAVQGVLSEERNIQLHATQQFRKLLAVDQKPPINAVIATGIVPRIVSFLRSENPYQLQLEAAWTLTNIASGTQDQTHIVTETGAIPLFIELLSSPIEDVRDQAVWALGNIAGDCTKCRDTVLQAKGLQPLLTQLRENTKVNILRNATWALSNLCRGNPQPSFELVAPALPILRQLIHRNDNEVLTDACWALSYMLDTKDNTHIDAVIESGVCNRLVELLSHPNHLVFNPALRSVGQIIAGTHHQTEIVVQCGVLKPLALMLSNSLVAVRKEACWVISNIAAGTPGQIQALIKSNLIEPLIQMLSTAEFEVKREIAWAISNAVIGGEREQVEYIIGCGCIKPLCDLLAIEDKSIIQVALEAIENILRIGHLKKQEMNLPENYYAQIIEEADGSAKLEKLQFSDPNGYVYKIVVRILTTYFNVEEAEFETDEDVSVNQPNMFADNPRILS